MCGIFLSAHHQGLPQSLEFEALTLALKAVNTSRGPDAQKNHRLNSGNERGTVELDFFASELRLRGNDYNVDQPHIREEDGNVLCWNGEIFEGLDVGSDENDGVQLFEATRGLKTVDEIRDLFASIEGPFAFVFYLRATRQLIFGRDPLGRRSLLIHKPSELHPYFMLASVSCGVNDAYSFEDLSTEHIHCLDVGGLGQDALIYSNFEARLTRFPRVLSSASSSFARPADVNTLIPPSDWPSVSSLTEVPDYFQDAVDGLIAHLDRSVMLRVQNIPRLPTATSSEARVAVLFSGGIDSTILTYLAHKHLPLDEPIDLLNVAFENPRKARLALEGNKPSKKQRKHNAADADPDVGEPVLVNYMVPDRKTGLDELEELKTLCPGRTWNFVEVDVPFQESNEFRSTVEALMFPNRTVMDLSLALALYFASRGIGQVRAHPDADPTPYTSPARVLLNGLGADELLGGYGRHRTAYTVGGWQAVIEELQLDIDRIPLRNLGRDDRVISCHGKETRHPFLSMPLLTFIAELPIQLKMDPRLDTGLGDKILLRLAAAKMGLVGASVRKKRAMQFGSRSARMDSDSKGDVVLD